MIRLLSVLAVISLFAGACSDDDKTTDNGDTTETTIDEAGDAGTTETTVADEMTETTVEEMTETTVAP